VEFFRLWIGRYRGLRAFLGPRVWLTLKWSVFVGFLSFLVESSFVYVLQGFIREMGLIEGSKLFLPSFYPRGLGVAIALLLVGGSFRALLVSAKTYFMGIVGQEFAQEQRVRILSTGLIHAHEISSAETITQFGERVYMASGALGHISRAVNAATAAFFLGAAGFWLLPIEASMGLVLVVVLMLPFRKVNAELKQSGKRLMKESKHTIQTLLVGIRNQFLLRIYGQVPKQIEVGTSALDRTFLEYRGFILKSSAKTSYPTFIGLLVLCLLSWFSLRVLNHDAARYLSFLYIFLRASQCLGEVSSSLAGMSFSVEGFRSLQGWYRRTANLEANGGDDEIVLMPESAPAGGVLIESKGLRFSFPEGPELYDGLDFRVGPGELLLLKGPSGSGKSTLLSLVLGLLQPTNGELLVSGQTPSRAKAWLYQRVGYVGPEPYLIEGSVRDNVLYGHTGRTPADSEIWETLKACGLSPGIFGPKGLDLPLGETAQLSTGQKQRLSFVRALLRKPLLLILDEATSNLDGQSETLIVEALARVLPGLTAVAITHRNAFDSLCSRQINLEPRA
jgi:ABC-type multidrug transport system fused ATPase/permease subunit